MATEPLSLPGEIWKPDILTGADFVLVSSLGRVRTVARSVVAEFSSGKRHRIRRYADAIVKQWAFTTRGGYLGVSIRIDKQERKFRVHRLVCAAFHGPPPPDKPFACHNNGCSSDNRPENLRWGSAEDNMADKVPHGTHSRGSRSSSAVIDESRAGEIKAALRAGRKPASIANDLGVSRNVVYLIAEGRTWKHVA